VAIGGRGACENAWQLADSLGIGNIKVMTLQVMPDVVIWSGQKYIASKVADAFFDQLLGEKMEDNPVFAIEGEKRKAAQKAAEYIFADIQKVANIEFKPVGKGEKLDIIIVEHNDGKSTGDGSTPGVRPVVMSKDLSAEDYSFGKKGYGTLTHEIFHTLGMSHPGAKVEDITMGPKSGGDNPLYDLESTIMSYNHTGTLQVMRPFDIATLQFLYGKARNTSASQDIKLSDLTESSVIAPRKATLDLTDAISGYLMVDFAEQNISGTLVDKNKISHPLRAYYGPDAAIAELHINPAADIILDQYGSDKPDQLQAGGVGNNRLIPRNGNDTLTLGKGNDRIELGPHSGMNNVMHGFDAAKDHIEMTGAKRAELRYRDDFKIGESIVSGTEILFKDEQGKILSSLFAKERNPEEIKDAITMLNRLQSLKPAPDSLPPGYVDDGKELQKDPDAVINVIEIAADKMPKSVIQPSLPAKPLKPNRR
jgi:hypothetical protein